MPRNRRDVGREEKAAEILDLAVARLISDGYAGLSVAGLARQLGVRQAAVQWYFPTKDDLFAAAAVRALAGAWRGKPSGDLTEQVLHVADGLARRRKVVVAIHDRARSNASAAALEAELLARGREMLASAFSGRSSSPERAADVVLAAVEGLVLRDAAARERRDTLTHLVSIVLSWQETKTP